MTIIIRDFKILREEYKALLIWTESFLSKFYSTFLAKVTTDVPGDINNYYFM